MTDEGDSFSKMTEPGLYTFFLLLLLSSFLPLFFWKDNGLTNISQSTAKGGKLSDCWIHHQKLQSVHDVRDTLVLSVGNLSNDLLLCTQEKYKWANSFLQDF